MTALTKTLQISDEVQDVLHRLEVQPVGDTWHVKIEEQLDRPLYQAVSKVFKALGGTWNRSAQATVFPHDPRAEFGQAVEGGTYDVVRDGWFPTPPAVIDLMLDFVDLPEGAYLEPSAGEGVIADTLAREGVALNSIQCVELNERRAAVLRAKGYPVAEADFMAWDSQRYFDRILMNPPFENGQDVLHVMKAASLLNRGGWLVAVMSEGVFFRSDKRSKSFRAYCRLRKGVRSLRLPSDSFKESGTGVHTRLLVIAPSDEALEPVEGLFTLERIER